MGLGDHPQGVQPWGNYLLTGVPECRHSGLGLLAPLSDEVLLEVLGRLPARALAALACASQACYCFAAHEDLWRSLVLQELGGAFTYAHSWRHTYVAALLGPARAPPPPPRRLAFPGVYSDLLFQPHRCASLALPEAWLAGDSIPRREGLSPEAFRVAFEEPNQPVVLTGLAAGWPACGKWSRTHLEAAFGGQPALVGNAPMALRDYWAYADAQRDELPLYLFDQGWLAKAPRLAREFEVPPHFRDDLFAVLGPDRPDHSWLIYGPERSGSTFHKDPNATSAWNAVVRGRKKWVLFPPSVTPPGVHPSPDGADVAAPVSIVEWFLNFLEEARAGDVTPLEGIVGPGDVLFIPQGWWHCALNLEETLAVTQNYIPVGRLPAVLAFLSAQSAHLVSGCRDGATLHARFLAALREQRPEVLQAAAQKRGLLLQPSKLQGLFSGADRQPPSKRQRRCKNPSSSPATGQAAVGEHQALEPACTEPFRFAFDVQAV